MFVTMGGPERAQVAGLMSPGEAVKGSDAIGEEDLPRHGIIEDSSRVVAGVGFLAWSP